MRGSTIRQKIGFCEICNKKGPLTKKKCQSCYWSDIRMKSVIRQEEKELEEDEDLQTLISDLDTIFSRYIRLREANANKEVECYCCGYIDKYTNMDCSHFISRSHMYTRFSENNVRVCCQSCNRMKDGNIGAFAKHLEKEHPGSVEILQEQSRIVYKYTREELKGMIAAYTKKLKQLT